MVSLEIALRNRKQKQWAGMIGKVGGEKGGHMVLEVNVRKGFMERMVNQGWILWKYREREDPRKSH